MKKTPDLHWLYAGIVTLSILTQSYAMARDGVKYIPLVGAVGNAMVNDVMKGKTFSSKAGVGLTGTLVLPSSKIYTNSIGMTFNLMPGGTKLSKFTMGSPADEPGGPYPDETQHQVYFSKSFYMQITEVTNKHWDIVIFDKGRGVSRSHRGENYPVEYINWYEAASFANWLSHDEGLIPCYNGHGTCTGTLGDDFTCTSVTNVTGCTGYHLPTESQWEYAARATTTTAWANPISFETSSDGLHTGAGLNRNLNAMGWYWYNELEEPYGTGPKPVAQKQANRWGLYDMHGNVMEWCQDWYGIYPTLPVTDPQGPVDGDYRVVRGGNWRTSAGGARSADRVGDLPPGLRSNLRGFRLVLPQAQ